MDSSQPLAVVMAFSAHTPSGLPVAAGGGGGGGRAAETDAGQRSEARRSLRRPSRRRRAPQYSQALLGSQAQFGK